MSVPWVKAGSLIHQWLPEGAWPEDIKLKDPSHLHKPECICLMLLWQEMDEDQPGGFSFTGWITDVGEPTTVNYEQYIKAWKNNAPA